MPSATLTDYVVDLNKSNVGGLRKVYFTTFKDLFLIKETDGEIEEITLIPPAKFYEFQVIKNASSCSANLTKNGFNSYYDESIRLVINRLTTEGSNLIQSFLDNTLLCIAEDRNGESLLLGRDVGLKFASGSIGSGTTSGDRNGYEFTLTSQAKKISHFKHKDAPVINVDRTFAMQYEIEFGY